jgi:hypothetical protein
MNDVFNTCVRIMEVGAHWLGITYQQFNVILFVIVHPLITIFLFYAFLYYRRKYLKSKRAEGLEKMDSKIL